MPIVRIEDSRPRSRAERQAVIKCIFDGLKSVFGVSDEELQARYQVLDPDGFFPPGVGAVNYMQLEIAVFAGRKAETKKKLYEFLAQNLSALLGVAPESILILLVEHPMENWGMRGGRLGSEIDFGYCVNV
ncbi:tautomerase family protein [Azohydromonas lata]|uniref:tautomerase family protein n=1 Tax=Azohydromonas lata TaxID=45677 RepID=UPI00082B609D|nr:tautomerase family protein [Azohydromonas lata]